jgi:hypothetical protein
LSTAKVEKEKNRGTNGSDGFDMKDAVIPGKDTRNWTFAVDNEGVYQVYEVFEIIHGYQLDVALSIPLALVEPFAPLANQRLAI